MIPTQVIKMINFLNGFFARKNIYPQKSKKKSSLKPSRQRYHHQHRKRAAEQRQLNINIEWEEVEPLCE
jgi:hypothetical protein